MTDQPTRVSLHEPADLVAGEAEPSAPDDLQDAIDAAATAVLYADGAEKPNTWGEQIAAAVMDVLRREGLVK